MPRAAPTHKPHGKRIAPIHMVVEGSKPGKWEGDLYRGNRHQRGYGTEWEHKRKRILARDEGLCVPCRKEGIITLAREVDHIVAKARGGSDDDDNLQSICRPCHKTKTARERLK
jgi:5-methylcytosine-specific restriction protein A